MRHLVECVPNFSEGRDPAVVEEIIRAILTVPGIALLDREMDRDHNRCVITFAGPAEVVGEAAVRGVARAVALIDLTRHTGAHPRLGATDVVPFVPLEGATMEECVEIARRAGEEIWRRCGVPVYYYEAAARDPARVNLENIRRGQFEGVREEVKTNPARRPDVGGPELHATAGATVVGARKFLIAYNINLSTPDADVARRIARKVRASSGGMPFVKAMGVQLHNPDRAQVSMNLTDFEQTPVHTVFEAVRAEAAKEGTAVEESEIIGLIPKKALEMAAAFFLKASNFHPGLVIENRVAEALARQESAAAPAQPSAAALAGVETAASGEAGLRAFLAEVSAPTAVPGGGSAAAAAGALAAALGLMVAGLAAKKKDLSQQQASELASLARQSESLRDFLQAAVWRDAASYEAVRQAYRLPKDDRSSAVEAALQGAASVPLEVAEAAAALQPLIHKLLRLAPAAMQSDLTVALALAVAAVRGARANVEINLEGIHDASFRSRAQEKITALDDSKR